MSNEIKDAGLFEGGELKIKWAYNHMPLLKSIEKDFEKNKPFKDKKIALSVHLEAKTAVLCRVLATGGAEMYVTGSNPLSTQDDIAAALVKGGMNVFALHGATDEQYERHMREVLSVGPDIIIDDGGDLVHLMHTRFRELLPKVLGGCEETTTGITRLKKMQKNGELEFPMMNVNDADCKHLFDNRYGTGQSVFDGIDRTTNLIIAGKTVVVAGYGWCGKGVAMRAKGLGASVVVTEIDPIKAIEAVMDGFKVMSMDDAAVIGDLFITVTGCCSVITSRHFEKMKDSAILCNAGHFDVEVDAAALRKAAKDHYEARRNIECFVMPNGNKLYLLAGGRLVNLAAGDGHPAEIMDMSFAIQALCAEYIANGKAGGRPGVHSVPHEIDQKVASLKLGFLGAKTDILTPEQAEYLGL